MKSIGAVLKRRWKLLTTVVVLAIALVGAGLIFTQKADASGYTTAVANRGDVSVTVSATGNVQAVTTVQVGSQTSGTVAWLGADYNSIVKQGQVIARLDPSTAEAQVENARASVANAQAAVSAAATDITNQTANVRAAKANEQVARIQRDDAASLAERYAGLKEVMSARDIESARTQEQMAAGRVVQATAQVAQAEAALQSSRSRLDQANAQLSQAKAQLDQALVNLDHTTITSPIDGIVVSRSVDVGQTVAASLSAPVLFTIANDLTKMRVLASVDEADVGQLHEGIQATFTVDAFPGETFKGTVSQIRLEAQSAQNVVTYTAVLEVANPDQRLKPGMTANITFPVASRENVLTVPNAALRFKPALSTEDQQALAEKMKARREQRAAEGADGPRQQADTQADAPRQTVWVLGQDGKVEPRMVRTGLTDGRVTEIIAGALDEGDAVVTGQNGGDAANTNRPSGSPFGMRPGGSSRSRR